MLVYGGTKNYLGHDKRWVGNLLLFPDMWSGNPCAQLWGGESHYYVGNECIVGGGGEKGSYPDPVGLDGTREGAVCRVDLKNASNAKLVGHMSDNTYWTQDGEWGFDCGNATADNHRFTLEEMQAGGRSVGSKVEKASSITAAILAAKARALLGI